MTMTKPGRTVLFSVTLADCEVSHMRAGGPGGQNQNKRDTATLIIHRPSGARGESREERSQLQNKKNAFHRMASHPAFVFWVHQEVRRREGHIATEVAVDRALRDPKQIRVEVKDSEGRWTEVPFAHPLDGIAEVKNLSVRIPAPNRSNR